MSADGHVDIDTLADTAAGLTDDDAAARVAEHLADCVGCRARAEALAEVTGALRSLPRPAMPPQVVDRIDSALLAAAGAPPTVVPLTSARRGRRRGRFAGLAAAAAGVALVGALIASHVVGAGTGSGGSGADEASSDSGVSVPTAVTAAAVRALQAVEHTRLPGYTSTDLATRLAGELGGNPPNPPYAGGASRSGQSHRAANAPARALAQKGAPSRTDAFSPAGMTKALAPLRSPTRMFACIRALTDTPGVTVPLRVEFTSYAGKPAVVVVVPDRYNSRQATAYVAGPRCGAPDAVSGDFITYRGALPR